ncbi:MAG: DUF4123 domain-containing protein [Acidobacteria bacterium]|nr:MAG: DUF4123 domain-containing protein [Acidobacteriota bacterium]
MTKDDLKRHLFSERTNVYAVLDGASINGLRMKLYQTDPVHFCLFRGDLTPDVAEMAPYLVGLVDGTEFTEWLLGECFGKHWGVFAHSPNSITEMRRHFRGLINVYDEAGKPMIFRYYDPRVMQNFLPTCNAGELKTFFGKVDVFFAEKGESTMVSFALENNDLKQKELN